MTNDVPPISREEAHEALRLIRRFEMVSEPGDPTFEKAQAFAGVVLYHLAKAMAGHDVPLPEEPPKRLGLVL